ncbi:MAG: efflux RND transporter periplasmic adaptor subunit, partial [bacterium]
RIDKATRQVKVRARLSNESKRLRPGLLLTVTLRAGEGEVLSVPEGALSPIGTRQRVYVVVDGKATLREVKIGRRQPGRVEILEGLQVGEPVVVDGVHKLRPGAPVQVVSEAVKPAPASAP